jgi:hypothetical protein
MGDDGGSTPCWTKKKVSRGRTSVHPMLSGRKRKCGSQYCLSIDKSSFMCKCKGIFYCREQCRLDDWPRHQESCMLTIRQNLPLIINNCHRDPREKAICKINGFEYAFAASVAQQSGDYQGATGLFLSALDQLLTSFGSKKQDADKPLIDSVGERVRAVAISKITGEQGLLCCIEMARVLAKISCEVTHQAAFGFLRILHEKIVGVALLNNIDTEYYSEYSFSMAVTFARNAVEMGNYRAVHDFFTPDILQQVKIKHAIVQIKLLSIQCSHESMLRCETSRQVVCNLLDEQQHILDHCGDKDSSEYNQFQAIHHYTRSRVCFDLSTHSGELARAQLSCVQALGKP